MKPRPRVKLNGVSSKNQSLQDILGTCAITDEVISVTPVINALHNTRLTLKKPDGEQRVHFYNRLDIANIIPADFRPSGNLQNDIEKLNLLGCDFNEDDLIVSNRRFVALPESLGYYGGIIERIFTDSISFGVKNHVGLKGDNDWARKITNIGISINGVTKEAEVDNTSDKYGENHPLYKNPTQRLITAIVDLLENDFNDLDVIVDNAYWLESSNNYINNEISGIVTVKNLNPNNAIEITIQGWSLQDLGSDGLYLQGHHNILPITRLEKRGTSKIATGLPSMVSLYAKDMMPDDSRPIPPENNSQQAMFEFGKLLQINDATGSNHMPNTYIGDRALPSISLYDARSGVVNLMRVIGINNDDNRVLDERMPLAHLINLLPQEIKLEGHPIIEPIILGPAPLAGLADRVFLESPYIPKWNDALGGTITLMIDDEPYTVSSQDAYVDDAEEIFLRLLNQYPNLKNKIIFTILKEDVNSDYWVYFQNLTDKPMHVYFYCENGEDTILNYYPPFTLEPLDTLKGSYELGVEENTTQSNPLVAELFNSRNLKTITWRGSVTDFNYAIDYNLAEAWLIGEFKSVLNISKTYSDDDEQVVEYFYSASPILEEFIFNEGMADEVKFQLTPMLLARAHRYT